MFRLPLIVTLIVVQIASGSGSLYLCVDRHGGFCCLDFGPEYCKCCRDDVDASTLAYASDADSVAGESVSCSCCHAISEEVPQESKSDQDDVVAIGSSCDCQHQLISIDRVLSRTYGKLVAEFVQTANAVAILHVPTLANLKIRWGNFIDGPPDLPDGVRLSLSTVVIRC